MADFDTPAASPALTKRAEDEVWESCVKGRVWVEVTDYRGAPRTASVLGVGSRLRLTKLDRERNQERVADPQGDPFVNGMLRRIDADQASEPLTESAQAVSDDDLKLVFELDQADFEQYVSELNELNVRRMKEMSPVHASVQQDAFLVKQLETRWPIGGDTPTYRELGLGEGN